MNSAGIKAKGREAENRVVEYLKANGFPYVERRRLSGVNDKGDIAGIPGVVIEVKAEKSFDLAGWVKELATEIANAGAFTGAVIHKRRGTLDVGRWYVTTTVEEFVRLLREAQ